MGIQAKFKTLVGELDHDGLEALRRSVAREIEGRRQKTAIKLGDIHPSMSAEEKEQAAQEIARVLRGQEVRDLKRYWREVRAIEASLPPFVWVKNLEGGAPVEVSAARAAPLLQEKSHRLATDEEIRARHAAETAKNREATRENLQRQGIAVVAIERE